MINELKAIIEKYMSRKLFVSLRKFFLIFAKNDFSISFIPSREGWESMCFVKRFAKLKGKPQSKGPKTAYTFYLPP